MSYAPEEKLKKKEKNSLYLFPLLFLALGLAMQSAERVIAWWIIVIVGMLIYFMFYKMYLDEIKSVMK